MKTEQAHESSRDTTAPSRTPRRGSLKRRLLAWFLVVALLPLTVVSSISYHLAKERLRAAALESLSASAENKTAFIENWFHYRFVDLKLQATNISNIRFLEELRDAFKAGGKDLGEFVGGYRWNAIVDARGEDLKTFRKLYGYKDVFLLDAEGNILFTVAGKNDLGTNLFGCPLAGTRFAAACQITLETGRPVFSDLEYYAPSNEAVAGFLASAIVDEYGEKIGVFAIQIAPEQVEYVVQGMDGASASVHAYVVGYSHEYDGVTLRMASGTGGPTEDAVRSSDSQAGGSPDFLCRRVDTEQTRLWMEGHGPDGTEPVGMAESAFVYDGPHGAGVLGVHKSFSIAGVRWGVIAEIPEHMAFAPANRLKNLVFGLALATGVLVVIIATVISRRIARPITELSRAAKLLAQGDLTQRIDNEATDEIGELARCFNSMVSSLRGCVRRSLFADNSGNLGKEAHLWQGLPIPAT